MEGAARVLGESGAGFLSCTRRELFSSVRQVWGLDSAGLAGDGNQRCDGVGRPGIWGAGRVNGAPWR